MQETAVPALSAEQLGTGRRTTICAVLAGDCLGGSHVSLRGLFEQLDPQEYRVVVVCEVQGGRLSEFFEDFEQIPDPAGLKQPFRSGDKFGVGSLMRTLPGVAARARLLKDLNADIVHSNDGRSHASWAFAAKLAGAKLVWHHRGDPGARGTSYVAPLLADQILAVSEFSLPRKRWGRLNEAQVVHSPFDVDLDVDREAQRIRIVQEFGCSEDAIICGFFGQFIDRKRPLEFIEAVRALGTMVERPVIGAMFGEAKDPDIERRMQMLIDGRNDIRVMGYREPGHEWIAGCDALLVTAINEPLGRTLVEAMLVGTPVIATRSGGNEEALRPDHGVLVPADDPMAMATAAAQLVRNPDRCSQMTTRASKMAMQRFTADRHLQQVTEVYARLADQRSTARTATSHAG